MSHLFLSQQRALIAVVEPDRNKVGHKQRIRVGRGVLFEPYRRDHKNSLSLACRMHRLTLLLGNKYSFLLVKVSTIHAAARRLSRLVPYASERSVRMKHGCTRSSHSSTSGKHLLCVRQHLPGLLSSDAHVWQRQRSLHQHLLPSLACQQGAPHRSSSLWVRDYFMPAFCLCTFVKNSLTSALARGCGLL